MTLVLARVDDRLIHGQVTVGWATHLKPDRLLLANNEIAADAWQSEVYAASVPREIEVSILSLAEAAAFLKRTTDQEEKVLLLTASVGEMAHLAGMGVPFKRINLGGLHYSSGKKEMLPFIYLGPDDLPSLRQLLGRGIRLNAQQVPGGVEHLVDAAAVQRMEDLF
ncbi:hypothetical protein CSA17_02055 [bacterium DOLJORAL78_65_58]|nr:MAG: hypothetical protein CSA17_02055 [bacterium DOLJORAL78_65_58]